MNAMVWGAKYLSYEELFVRNMQITEYFTTGHVSTKFTELAEPLLKMKELEELIRANKAFYIEGTPTIH